MLILKTFILLHYYRNLSCFIYVWQKHMHKMKFISLKLCRPNAWTFYMQFKYINHKFRPKYVVRLYRNHWRCNLNPLRIFDHQAQLLKEMRTNSVLQVWEFHLEMLRAFTVKIGNERLLTAAPRGWISSLVFGEMHVCLWPYVCGVNMCSVC